MPALSKKIHSSDVEQIINDALVNLGEVRSGATWEISRGIQEAESFFSRGFTDESYKDERTIYHEKIGSIKTNRFVVTTCEALECFFIPCIDLETFKLRTYLSNINGLADCFLNDIIYLIDNVLIKNDICFRGEPYSSQKKSSMRGSLREEIIENTDAGSFILSTILMAKYFVPELIQYSLDKSKYDERKLNDNLDKIINKGIEELLKLNTAVNGKGWPLAVNSKEPSIYATWSTLEFIEDLFTYREKLKLDNFVDIGKWNEIEKAKKETLNWLEKECIEKVKSKLNISVSDRKAYAILNKEIRDIEKRISEKGVFNEDQFVTDRESIIRKFGVVKKNKIEEGFLPIYDKVQVVFSLLLCGCGNSNLIENMISEILEYYFDRNPDGIWENFINLYYPPIKEYGLTDKSALTDYGIVFEVMRLMLQYAERQRDDMFFDKLGEHRLQEKLNTIYSDDSINDRNTIEKKYKYLWSKFQFELNYTENAVEALTSYVIFLRRLEKHIREEKGRLSKGTINFSLDMKELVHVLMQDEDFINLLKTHSGDNANLEETSTIEKINTMSIENRNAIREIRDFKMKAESLLNKLEPHIDSLIELGKSQKDVKKKFSDITE